MKAAVTMDEAPGFDLTLATRLLPGAVSAVALLLTVMVMEHVRRGLDVLVPLLYLQAPLLALGAAGLTAAASGRLSRWEARVAPQLAHRRVHAGLRRGLRDMAAIGLAGPLALAAVTASKGGGVQPLLATLAVLGASLCAGCCAVQGWEGRAPRWMLPFALAAALALLALPGAMAAVGEDGLLALAILAVTTVALWHCVLAPRALVVRAPAWPLPNLPRWWQRAWAHRGWEVVRYEQPYRTLGGQVSRPTNLKWMGFAWLPQFITQAQHLGWLDWGRTYDHGYAAAGYGAWMLLVGSFVGTYLVAPRLHWRRRLAPGGLTPRRWARRLVLGSMLGYAVALSLGLTLAVLANYWASRPLHAASWPLAIGDLLLASSFGAWQRGRYEGRVAGVLWMMGFGFAAFTVLAFLPLLGVIPVRGWLWLLIELASSLWLTRAAIRVWAARDPNTLA
ncbi:hypothetical protein J2X16_000901 [Pelomonas aquatica]|uniref:ABC transporter permease n=1 Tax=Pelomonas aquatica TaxID=431058 RepID=A0ABU1Z4P7_9BURK|nr:hypothetical protein [Pelomonas aquatica]MDR7295580.1 hypothetical protein [Pelomonas aquatica]